MASFGQILGVALSFVGFLGSMITCALPMWKCTVFIGRNRLTGQVIWEGLWMICVIQSTGHMQCQVYDSMLALPVDIKAARALLIISILLSVVGLLLAVVGRNGKCTSGVFFIIAGLLCLTSVCWSANNIFQDFYNPHLSEMRREVGASLYMGWGFAALLLSGGAKLCCCQCPPKRERAFVAKKPAPKSNDSEKEIE